MLWVKRCQKDPSVYEKNFGSEEIGDGLDNVQEYSPLTGREIIILILFFGTFIFFAAGGVALNLSMLPLASVVLPLVLVIGFLGGAFPAFPIPWCGCWAKKGCGGRLLSSSFLPSPAPSPCRRCCWITTP